MATVEPDPRRGVRGPAPSRSRDEIVLAAVLLADRSGLGAVTIRSVAPLVRLAPAALYRYVDSKQALVEAMADRAFADLVLPGTGGDAAADLVALVRAQVEVLRSHPWLVDTLPDVRPGPTGIAVLEEGLRILAAERASSTAKLELLGVLTGVASLFARASAAPPAGTVEAMRAAAPTHPRLAAAFADPGPAPAEDLLRRTVEALIVGLLR